MRQGGAAGSMQSVACGCAHVRMRIMRSTRLRSTFPLAALALWLTVCPLLLHAQAPDLKAELLARVNEMRLGEGLPPYARFRLLESAAQGHAQDLASNGLFSSTGSNGSTPGHRIAAAGYTAWRRDDGEPVGFLLGLRPRLGLGPLVLALHRRDLPFLRFHAHPDVGLQCRCIASAVRAA